MKNHEASANQPVPQELSPAEVKLSELNRGIQAIRNYLMDTFFQADTWSVRQLLTYGDEFSGLGEEATDPSLDADQIISEIRSSLGNRIGYFEAAYHFPDRLLAWYHMSASYWMDMIAEDEPNKPRSTIAEELFQNAVGDVKLVADELEKFFKSDEFRSAFTITKNMETGAYQIDDLALDEHVMRATWQEHLGKFVSLEV